MASEKRLAELAGIGRAQWEREERNSKLHSWEPGGWEPIPIPPKTPKRLRMEAIAKDAWPDLREPATLTRTLRKTLFLIIARGINGRELRRYESEHLSHSKQSQAVREFLASELDWVSIE